MHDFHEPYDTSARLTVTLQIGIHVALASPKICEVNTLCNTDIEEHAIIQRHQPQTINLLYESRILTMHGEMRD